MLEVLRRASERVFVPLTVGGGIKALTDSSGRSFSAVEVAAEYFRWAAGRDGQRICALIYIGLRLLCMRERLVYALPCCITGSLGQGKY